MSVPCPAFCFSKEVAFGLAQGRCACALPQILFGSVRQRWRSWRRCGMSFIVSACSRVSAAASCSAASAAAARRGRGERVFHDGRAGLRAAAAEHLLHVLFSGDPQAGRCVFRLRRAGARHQRRADFAAAGRAWATSIWWAMPVTELLVACCATAAMRRATRALPSC